MSGHCRSRRGPLLLVYAALVFVFIYLPVIVLILYSFNRDGVGGFPPRHLTLAWYRQLFADAPLWDAVANSLKVAAGSVTLSLTLGLLAALALDRASFPGKALFRRLVLLPLFLPGIITGLSLLMFAVFAGMQLSLRTVFLGHGTALISVATTEIFAGLQKLDRAQEEASLDLGATPWQTFWRITLPNLKLTLIAAPPDTKAAPQLDGEHFDICHQVRDGHRFEGPAETRSAAIVIIGGGVAGLSAAYFLRGQDFLLLEKEDHFGGNAYQEEYQ